VCVASGGEGKISGQAAKPVLQQTGLPTDVLSKIWKLSDIDKDGKLDLEEFMVFVGVGVGAVCGVRVGLGVWCVVYVGRG
jgi:hypothetical protein